MGKFAGKDNIDIQPIKQRWEPEYSSRKQQATATEEGATWKQTQMHPPALPRQPTHRGRSLDGESQASSSRVSTADSAEAWRGRPTPANGSGAIGKRSGEVAAIATTGVLQVVGVTGTWALAPQVSRIGEID